MHFSWCQIIVEISKIQLNNVYIIPAATYNYRTVLLHLTGLGFALPVLHQNDLQMDHNPCLSASSARSFPICLWYPPSLVIRKLFSPADHKLAQSISPLSRNQTHDMRHKFIKHFIFTVVYGWFRLLILSGLTIISPS